eukprot:scaffold88965_cov27-Tisochrysis_lutea.AAC.1
MYAFNVHVVLDKLPYGLVSSIMSAQFLSLPILTSKCNHCTAHTTIQVYEHLTLNGTKHVSLRTLPGMAERSIRLGSAGKTFSFTAWKVG